MNSTLNFKKQFIFGGYNAEYQLHSKIKPSGIARLTDYILNVVLPAPTLSGGILLDLKGKDFPVAKGSEELLEEIFYVSGEAPQTQILDDDPNSEQTVYVDFTLQILSEFDSFEGNHHIKHRTKIIRSSELPDYLSVGQLGRVFPLKINTLRLGLEVFQSRCFFASLGFAPIVTQTLQISCCKEDLNISITAENLKNKTVKPLQKDDLLNKISFITEELADISIQKEWRAHC